MPNSLFRAAAVVVVGCMLVLGCSSQAEKESLPATDGRNEPQAAQLPEPVLDGAYITDDPQHSALRAIIFKRTHEYTVVWSSISPHCKTTPLMPSGVCIARGTFSFNDKRDHLELNDKDSGERTSLPFTASQLPSQKSPTTLRTLDNKDGPLATPAEGSLTNSESAQLQYAAVDDEPVHLVDVGMELQNRLMHCFVVDWKAIAWAERTDDRYSDSGFFTALGILVAKPMGYVFNAIGYLLFYGQDAETEFQAIENDMRMTIQAQSMNDHQRAAMVTCISSSIIDYGSDLIATITGSSGAVDAREGVCREFAAIAHRLFGAVDLDSGRKYGTIRRPDGNTGGHAWNWVRIPSQKNAIFWMEPQADGASGVPPFFNRRDEPPPCETDPLSLCTTIEECSSPYANAVTTSASCEGATGGPQCCKLLEAVPL